MLANRPVLSKFCLAVNRVARDDRLLEEIRMTAITKRSLEQIRNGEDRLVFPQGLKPI